MPHIAAKPYVGLLKSHLYEMFRHSGFIYQTDYYLTTLLSISEKCNFNITISTSEVKCNMVYDKMIEKLNNMRDLNEFVACGECAQSDVWYF